MYTICPFEEVEPSVSVNVGRAVHQYLSSPQGQHIEGSRPNTSRSLKAYTEM